ncbi:MAG: cysteine desulfurase-like protein [Thermoanaerobaculia bacterium]
MPFDATACQQARLQFPALARRQGGQPIAFLDGPAGSQMPAPVIDAISGYYREANANTHGQFATAQRSDELLHAVREKAAAFLGAASWRSISFGANMTTLSFALAHAVGRACSPGDEIVVTQLDHEANRGPWLGLAERGLVIREVALLADGTLDAASLAAAIGPRTRLVAMGLASNALGTVNDVARARELTRAVGAWLLLDAVHYAPHFAVDVAAMDPDFLLCSAYKFYGPHVGLLYSRPGLLDTLATDRLRTQDPSAPFRIETGTLNHAALVGVGAAIDFLASWGRGDDLRQRLVDAMAGIGEWEGALARRYGSAVQAIPGVTVHGPAFASGPRAPTVSITLAGVPAEVVARRLGERGIQVWDGDFYALRAVEVLGLAGVGGLLRTGFLLYNTPEEVDRLLAGLSEIAASAG